MTRCHLLNFDALFAKAEFLDDCTVPVDVRLFEVSEQIPALTDHFQEAASRVMVFLVGLQVVGQIVNSLSQERDLHLRRARVTLVHCIGLDNRFFLCFQHICSTFYIYFRKTQNKAGVHLTKEADTLNPRNRLVLCLPTINTYLNSV